MYVMAYLCEVGVYFSAAVSLNSVIRTSVFGSGYVEDNNEE